MIGVRRRGGFSQALLPREAGYGHCLLDLSAEDHGRILYIVVKAKTFGQSGYGWERIGTVATSFADLLTKLTPDFLRLPPVRSERNALDQELQPQ